MPDSLMLEDGLARQAPRARLLSWLLPLVVLLLGLGMTAAAWREARQVGRQETRRDFEFQVRRIETLLHQRMATYEQVLRGAQGFMRGRASVDRGDFAGYIATLRLEESFPGIQGIAIAELMPPDRRAARIAAVRADGLPDFALRPDGERPVYSGIVQIEPANRMNLRALGYDMLTEPVRRAAMEAARDSGVAAVSGKLRLVQEGEANVQNGVIVYLPIYGRGLPVATVGERRAGLVAWIGGPFRMADLMRGLLGERADDLRLQIFDGAGVAEQARLYDSAEADAAPAQPALQTTRQLRVADREWTLAVQSTPVFEARFDPGRPLFIGGAGLGMSLLLAALVWQLASGRSRALALAGGMTRALRASQLRWKYALEGAGDGVWDWNNLTNEVVFSRRWKEMLGYGESELVDSVALWADLLHPEDREDTLKALSDYVAGRIPLYAREVRMRCRDGSWKWLLTRGSVVSRDAAGRALRTIGTHTDISDRREAERMRNAHRRSLEEARSALHHAQKLEAVGKLTGGIAHDFNNVLQIISGYLQLMQREAAAGSLLQRQVQRALDAVDRGARLSSRLLSFARRQPLQPVAVNVARLVDGMQELLHSALGASVTLSVAAPDALWNTLVDRDQLQNVILNLAINARDAMDGVGSLTIRLENATLGAASLSSQPGLPAGDHVVLTMQDSGAGMTADVRERAFEPFFTTKAEGVGTGLGLSMAYGFVTQSGGHIDIASAPGEGATLRIYLPRADLPEAAPAPAQALGQAVMGGDEQVLVVEDDEAVRGSVCAMLAGLGYQVQSAGDADAALRLLQQGVAADLLFTDVVMPGALSAPELVRAALALRPDLAVLYTSGYTREAVLHAGAGSVALLLKKPYRREQLAQKIREALDRRR